MNVNIKINGESHATEKGILLCDALSSLGYAAQMTCGGNGKCGKCAVISHGALSPMTDDEKRVLEGKRGMRLACRAVIEGDCEVVLDDKRGIASAAVSDTFCIPPSGKQGIGYAVDIGTTTVSVSGYDLTSGRQISSTLMPNPQRRFGDDVISRIDHCMKNGVSELKADITNTVDAATPNAAERVFVGNTPMMLISRGIDPSPLGAAPYTSPELFGKRYGNDLYPPCIHGFAGSDLTAAMLACGMLEKSEISLLCDIGTNCEIALYDGKRLTVCSAAAGPCFEGYGIKNGMPASDGAIYAVGRGENGYICKTIGGIAAKGFCGSGLTDAAALLLKDGAITAEGHMAESVYFDGVELTPADIRALQLAKAAVATGITLLMKHSGIGASKVSRVYLAGGLGSSINTASACDIGILPREFDGITSAIGNAAATGAALMLTDDNARKKAANAASMAEYIDLTTDTDFEEVFTEELFFRLTAKKSDVVPYGH